MSQVNAALHCFFPCWYREAPRAEPPPAARRTGRASTGDPLALRHANDRAPRSDIVKDQPAPTAQARRRFTRRRSGPDMIVTASWRRHGHSQHAASSSTSGTTDSGS